MSVREEVGGGLLSKAVVLDVMAAYLDVMAAYLGVLFGALNIAVATCLTPAVCKRCTEDHDKYMWSHSREEGGGGRGIQHPPPSGW